MRPVETIRTTGVYGAPPGLESKIDGLPYWRTRDPALDGPTIVWSEWELDADERATLLAGGRVLVHVVGEPIRPFGLSVIAPDVDTSRD